jgi:hypothetical protein
MNVRLLGLLASVAVLGLNQIYVPVVRSELGCQYWIAPPPLGDDANPGSDDAPWATLRHAAEEVDDNHCTVWVVDGVYDGKNSIKRRFETQTRFKAVHPYHAVFEYAGSPLVIRGGRNMVFEGFEFRHTGPGSEQIVVQVYHDDNVHSDHITFRNNIFHDSYNNDLLKIYVGSGYITVEGNIFYNRGPNEQHMDVNSVHDVLIKNNIFFNDYAGSGRSVPPDAKHFIVVKDSNGPDDGLTGSRRVTVSGNIFMSWQGGVETFIKVGNDGKPYYEAQDIMIENNLMLGNGSDPVAASFGVRGARNVTFRNNTVAGDLPSSAYAMRLSIAGENPVNESIVFYNNIWSDPTGTMGASGPEDGNDFSSGDPAENRALVLENNLYWNGGQEIPGGDVLDPLRDDRHYMSGDPALQTDQQDILLPRWDGQGFASGSATIRQEFERLVNEYGSLGGSSAAIDRADPALAPAEDILGRRRDASPDLGAFEYEVELAGLARLTDLSLFWSDATGTQAEALRLNLYGPENQRVVENLPSTTRSYTFQGIQPYQLYVATLTLLDDQGQIINQTEPVFLRADSPVETAAPADPSQTS